MAQALPECSTHEVVCVCALMQDCLTTSRIPLDACLPSVVATTAGETCLVWPPLGLLPTSDDTATAQACGSHTNGNAMYRCLNALIQFGTRWELNDVG